ncbi:MAG TPA: glycosyltransferase family 1 protein [Terriglobales bacterium]|nr:glycosyltransferase family 1 protein [Terriglobales bacterium]
MIHLFINALAASAGGGLTYVRNVVPELARRTDLRATILIRTDLREEFGSFPNLDFVQARISGMFSRMWFEQRQVAELVLRSGADVLISTGNFALQKSPVPQVLLSRNALYTSDDFFRDLLNRRDYAMYLDTAIKRAAARRSIRTADCRLAPSTAFAAQLQQWCGVSVKAVHHGFDPKRFVSEAVPLASDIQAEIEEADGDLKLLFVSHYNYYRNFETLIRALPRLRERLAPRRFKLLLTCKVRGEHQAGGYRTKKVSNLINQLGVGCSILELGAVPYRSLRHLYAQCDVYVTPAYAESFAHPLVEAMACGLPIVASDIPVHREICGEAALYFDRFSAGQLAERVMELASSPETTKQKRGLGLKRSRQFSWKNHVDQLVFYAAGLLNGIFEQDANHVSDYISQDFSHVANADCGSSC